jgi:hypothetical protein
MRRPCDAQGATQESNVSLRLKWLLIQRDQPAVLRARNRPCFAGNLSLQRTMALFPVLGTQYATSR